MSDVDPEVLDVFRAEANERLDRMDELLLGIEEGSAPADAIDLLFRDVHSVKGSAGMVGYDGTRSTAHALEDKLSEARTGDTLDSDTVEPLLRLIEAVRLTLGGDEPIAEPPSTLQPASAGRVPAASPSSAPTIRMPAEKIDRLLDAVGESVLQMRTLEGVLDGSRDDGTAEWELDRGKVLLDDLQRAAIDMRTLPLGSIVGRYPRSVRELALGEGKEVVLDTSGMETPLDRVILDGIAEPLSHMLSQRGRAWHRVARRARARGQASLRADRPAGRTARQPRRRRGGG